MSRLNNLDKVRNALSEMLSETQEQITTARSNYDVGTVFMLESRYEALHKLATDQQAMTTLGNKLKLNLVAVPA